MLYYHLTKAQVINDNELTDEGHANEDFEALAKSDIFPLTIEQPKYDVASEGIEPDGTPMPDSDKPGWWIQRMRVYSIVEYFKKTMKAQVTERRWVHEIGGIEFPDASKPPIVLPDDWPEDRPKPANLQPMVRINTTIDDQNRISSALQGMTDANITEVDFKAESGWVRLSREQLAGVAALIAAHVQACFSRERALHEAIDAVSTLEELHAIDVNTGWPGQTDNVAPQPPESTIEATTSITTEALADTLAKATA